MVAPIKLSNGDKSVKYCAKYALLYLLEAKLNPYIFGVDFYTTLSQGGEES